MIKDGAGKAGSEKVRWSDPWEGGGGGGFMMSLAGERRIHHKYTPPFLTGAQPRGRGEGALKRTQNTFKSVEKLSLSQMGCKATPHFRK